MEVPGPEPSDEELATRAAAGDELAFEEIVRRYHGRVFRLASRLTGSETDAADVLQETLLRVFRGLPSFRGASRFGTWLYRIATNAALAHRRARSRRPSESLEAFLPRFDGNGMHLATPAQLQVATRVEERLDRQALADTTRRGQESSGCPTFTARLSSSATSRRCRPRRWRRCWAWSRRRCGSACTGHGSCCAGTCPISQG
jgi:RNA polymerase sigma factor (sigma-70 family)